MGLFSKKKPKFAEGERKIAIGSESDAPWVQASLLHNDTFLRLAAQTANWRIFGFFALAIAAVAVCGAIYIGGQSKFIPLVIEVDKLGQTVAVRALTGDDATSDPKRVVYREMFDLMENLRTVSTDRLANNQRLDKGFSRLKSAGYAYVRAELKKNPPNEVGAIKSVQVKVKTALKLAGKSWQIDWEERSFSLAGEEIGLETWRATLQYELIPSGEESAIRTNPIGFTVTDLSWQKVIL
jgi:type IV secretion system protein TrbF